MTGLNLYGVWRQSLDKKQSIFYVSNLTEKNIEFSLLDINLESSENWINLISGKKYLILRLN